MRVKSVVGRSIRVDVRNVVPGDILYADGTEQDPLITNVEQKDGLVRFHYKSVPWSDINESHWMDPDDRRFGNGSTFIHDLKRERDEFEFINE